MSIDRELTEALDALRERLGKKKPRVGHHDARLLLVALGRRILRDGPAASEAVVDDARALLEPVREAWTAAVERELEMATLEHVQGVDPRYLEHPRYDFEYTLDARERLEARLRAAEALDHEVPDETLARIARADETLEPYLERRRAAERG
jgi:hypothetical protein